MPSNRTVKWGGAVILFLIFANVVCHVYWNWGLITVKVHDAPLSKVIKSIEWQGWVKIYTNLPADSKVTMYVDHVPLAEAMEALATNVDRPPRDNNGGPNGNPPGGAPPVAGGAAPPTDGGAAGNPPAGSPPGAPSGQPAVAGGGPGAGGPPGGRGGRGGGFGGGGFGGGASWNLGFFVAPTAAQVKAEIHAFEAGTPDDDTRVYTYPTNLNFLATDTEMPAADPRLQTWPGYTAPDLSAAPPAPPAADGQAATATPPVDTKPTVQTYLQAFAESSNIWIMTPGTWAPEVATPPPANPSIIKAIKNFVSNSHGAMTQAIILRSGRGARGGGNVANRGGGGGPFGFNMDAMAARTNNAINGLPADEREGARAQLQQEVDFFKSVQAAPDADKMKMMQDHMMAKLANGNGMGRMSPEKRASRMARAVSARQAVRGK